MRSASPASSLVVTTPSAALARTARVPQLTEQAQRAPLRLHADGSIAERQCGERVASIQVHIDVVSQSPTFRASISELLADDRTAVQQHATISSLQGPHHADLIVLD